MNNNNITKIVGRVVKNEITINLLIINISALRFADLRLAMNLWFFIKFKLWILPLICYYVSARKLPFFKSLIRKRQRQLIVY